MDVQLQALEYIGFHTRKRKDFLPHPSCHMDLLAFYIEAAVSNTKTAKFLPKIIFWSISSKSWDKSWDKLRPIPTLPDLRLKIGETRDWPRYFPNCLENSKSLGFLSEFFSPRDISPIVACHSMP